MERYQRVEKPKPEQPINENEIRITAQGLIRNYVTYATSLFEDKKEKEIVLKAMGQAISKAVAISEIIKKRIPGLHQNISTSSTTITDAYEPIEEGLNPLEMKRQVSLISIALSTLELNKNSPGYQAPTVKQAEGDNHKEHQNEQSIVSADVGEGNVEGRLQGRGGAQGRARGRGRGRGRGSSGYDDYQESRGYYNWSEGGSRSRGRGGYGDNQEYSGYYYRGNRGGRGLGRGGYNDYQEHSGYYSRGNGGGRGRGRAGYGDYQENSGYYSMGGGGNRGRGRGGYGDYQENDGYYDWGEGGGRGRGRGYRGAGYERGRGSRRGRGRYGYARGRGAGNQE